MSDYSQEIIQLSDELALISDEFKKACVKYAEHYYNFQKLLGIRIIKLQNKKPSIEKIIAESLAETSSDGFDLHYKGYVYHKALKEGLEAQIEALRSKIMARQSVLRFNGKMDSFGNA